MNIQLKHIPGGLFCHCPDCEILATFKKTQQIAREVEREFSQSSDLGRSPALSLVELGQGGN